MPIRFFVLVFFGLLWCQFSKAGDPVVFKDSSKLMQIGASLDLYQDSTSKLTINDIGKQPFKPSGQAVPNLQISAFTHWARFSITNETDVRVLLLEVEYPTIDEITLYEMQPGGGYKEVALGQYKPFNERPYNHQNYIFPLEIPQGESRVFYFKVRAGEQAQLPVYLGVETTMNFKNTERNFIFGLYIGIILVMALYNLFIYISIRDTSYLYYVGYIICVGLTQASQQGYTFRFLWPNNLWFATHDTLLIPIFNGITAAIFIQSFLHTREKYKTGHNILNGVVAAYLLCLIPMFMDQFFIANMMSQMIAMFASLLAIFVGIKVSIKGFIPARYFLVAWGIFLTSVVVFVMRNFNVLPYNDFTYYALQVGSAAEVTLLSFALANKINIYRKEKEESQAMALLVSQENEQLVREQNVILEAKVQERTEALQTSNKELNKVLTNLKEAQTQLVESEKMASLGQLTAGIAHEINNPINFVTSNIKPLKLDFEDLKSLLKRYEALAPNGDITEQLKEIDQYKQQIDIEYVHTEIDSLIKGIEDGANRTAEIVKGLRTFSRLDESDLKFVDIHEGINSTLVLLRNTMPKNVTIVQDFGELPKIECYAGKLNQVFLNIINNALNAIKMKPVQGDEKLTITTRLMENKQVSIGIRDTGIGMTDKVKEKIFEPFFTTKDVGEGTGLGLSIVFSIIEKHHGKILVESTPGIGTEFIIYLPQNVPSIQSHMS
ncbi:GHKL domain-containing protein [Chitinophaga sp. SYP-B3965]|uniref:sensor histidine kinase n=1 Tax=Chitinophaga sp. SYP-B3965 TaxID=2663120 RepID=UPI00129A048F|nr:7TM diverse intracellular signaling domain-containing protein [Chitinophaga sp. SYP-B3965]MRG47867.1 GHKL domain-containing protein [Chitinophaga sp. SYP-B3965]